jgi:hypothetical protein
LVGGQYIVILLLWRFGLHSTKPGPKTSGIISHKPRAPGGRADTVGVTDQAEAAVLRRDLLALVFAALSGRSVPAVAGLLGAPEATATVRVGSADVQRVQGINASLYSTDLLVGGAAVTVPKLLDQFRTASGLMHGRYAHDSTRAQMHSAVAHLGSTVGYMLFDAGEHLRARQVYTASLVVAREAPDRLPLRAIICSEMARQCRHLGALPQAHVLLAAAHRADAELTATSRAMLYALAATVSASGGDRPRALRVHWPGRGYLRRGDSAADPDWITWFDHAELCGETGAALAQLAVHHEDLRDDAATRLTESARGHGPGEQRSTALALIRLAGIHAARQQPAAATTAARQALDMTARLRSPRVVDELVHLRRLLRPLHSTAEVVDIDRQLAALQR